jgi:transposase
MRAMLDYTISAEMLAELRAAHRKMQDKREADRRKAVVLLATGWTAEEVAEVLQVEPNTVRNHFKCYRKGGIEALSRIDAGVGGSTCALSAEQLAILDAHLQEHLYLSAKAIAHWVKDRFGASYTESGMTALLHRLGYVYKKPKLVPGKADRQAQEQFLVEYDTTLQNKGKDDPVYFITSWTPSIRKTIRYSLVAGSSAVRSKR